MNPIVEEIRSYFGISERTDENTLEHYGMPRRSGRYPYGSGEDPYQHSTDFLGRVEELRKQDFTYTDDNGRTWRGDTAIAKSIGMSTTQFRTELSLVENERRMLAVKRVESLRQDGLNTSQIARVMGVNESTIRGYEKQSAKDNMLAARNAADLIKKRIDETGGMVEVGSGVERELNISAEKMKQALYLVQREGYPVYSARVQQATNKNQSTTYTVACPPGTEHKDAYNLDKITSLKEYICRDGETFEKKFHYPSSMDSKRLMVRYKEDGGIDRDGVIELRRGLDDLSLGENRYSQVRILVDGTHYLKGMAVYSDDMPPGVDVIFNTNKKKGTPALGPKDNTVLKPIKKDPDNPFGSAIKDVEQGGQYWYTDKNGEKKLGLVNKRATEGDWSDWADALPSQFLSKQSKYMAKKQLDIAIADKEAEFADIMALDNPTIKKHFLSKFSDECDSAAVHLKAAALPGQKYHVILPINTLKDTEVYAPNYENGTKLALIRYPHGGTFEIPILTVNNKHPEARKLLGTSVPDAVGITSKVAERLSGADFDGDTVMCIPTHDPQGKVKIISKNELKGLKGFDAKVKYGPDTYEKGTVRLMTKAGTQKQMGIISNLITDMTLSGGATDAELAAAVRHSQVIIDAEKHQLNYKKSELDNNIAALHKKYQGKETGGASTIISKAKGEATVDKRQGTPKINMKYKKNGEPNPDYDPSRPEGALVYKKADDLYYPDRSYDKSTGKVTIRLEGSKKKITYDVNDKEARDFYEPVEVKDKTTGQVIGYTNKTGEYTYRVKTRTQKSTKMAEVDDAYDLVSEARHPMEIIYADFANKMKSMANRARKELMVTEETKLNPTAAKVYKEEAHALDTKISEAIKNSPRERLAQIKAKAEIDAKKKADPDMSKEDIKKLSQQAITKYRTEVGSVKRSDRSIEITDREWEAIQAGAISSTKLKQILNNSDIDKLRERATPKTKGNALGDAKIARIKQLSSTYSIDEIARKMGVSTSTVSKYLKGVS